MEADYLSWGQLVPEWHLLPYIAQAAFLFWSQQEVDLLASLCNNQCQDFYTLKGPLHLGVLGLNSLQPLLDLSGELCISCPGLVPLVLSKFLPECLTGHFRFLILVAPCWVEVPWLPIVLNMLADIPNKCSIVEDLIMDVVVGQVLKCLQSLHLISLLLRDVCCTDKGSVP